MSSVIYRDRILAAELLPGDIVVRKTLMGQESRISLMIEVLDFPGNMRAIRWLSECGRIKEYNFEKTQGAVFEYGSGRSGERKDLFIIKN
jgi:hypothetical protein